MEIVPETNLIKIKERVQKSFLNLKTNLKEEHIKHFISNPDVFISKLQKFEFCELEKGVYSINFDKNTYDIGDSFLLAISPYSEIHLLIEKMIQLHFLKELILFFQGFYTEKNQSNIYNAFNIISQIESDADNFTISTAIHFRIGTLTEEESKSFKISSILKEYIYAFLKGCEIGDKSKNGIIKTISYIKLNSYLKWTLRYAYMGKFIVDNRSLGWNEILKNIDKFLSTSCILEISNYGKFDAKIESIDLEDLETKRGICCSYGNKLLKCDIDVNLLLKTISNCNWDDIPNEYRRFIENNLNNFENSFNNGFYSFSISE
jgi:hypothetical protein